MYLGDWGECIYIFIYHIDHCTGLHSEKYVDHVIQGFINAENKSSYHT